MACEARERVRETRRDIRNWTVLIGQLEELVFIDFFNILTTFLKPVPRWSNAGPLDQWQFNTRDSRPHKLSEIQSHRRFSIPETDTHYIFFVTQFGRKALPYHN